MSRWEAAKKTAGVLTALGIFAWALDRWPYATAGSVTVASIYQTFRNQPEQVAAGE